jgi:hypothetical protein
MKTSAAILLLHPEMTELSFRPMCTMSLSSLFDYSSLFFTVFIYYAFKPHCNQITINLDKYVLLSVVMCGR